MVRCLGASLFILYSATGQASDQAGDVNVSHKQGLYFGLHLGGGNGSISTTQGSVTEKGSFDAGDHDGGGLLVGWNLRRGHTLVGLETAVSVNEIKGHHFNGSLPDHSSDYVWHLEARARAGYQLGRFLPFVAGGLVAGEFYLQNGPSASGPRGDLNRVFGYTIGAGMDVQLTNGLALRSEYLFQNFPRQTYRLAGSQTLESGFDVHLGRMALIYQLGSSFQDRAPDRTLLFSGPSLGFTAGATQGQLSMTGYGSGSLPFETGTLGARVGYLHPVGTFRLGAEVVLDGHLGNRGFSPSGSLTSFDHRLIWSAAFRAKMGLVQGRFMPYATAGLNLGQFTAKSQPSSNTMLEPFKNGHSFGAGIEYAITDRLSLDAGYNFNVYNGTNINTNGNQTRLRQNFHQVRLGLVLR